MQKQQIYDIVINSLPVGFSMVDKDGIVLDFNPAAEAITGYSKEEALGKPHLEILHGTSDEDACPLHKHALQQREQTVAMETTIKKKNGERIALSVATSPLFDDQGVLAGGVELFRDITETKRLERERKNMLTMFAHDMKNPVMASGGFVSRLLSGKDGALTDKQKNHLEIIREELDRLAGLLTDFLEFSLLETKEYKPVPAPFDIETEMRKTVETTRMEAEKKNIKLVFERFGEKPPTSNVDASMIKRMIANLLDNAIKYTGPGGTITVRLSEGEEENMLVSVTDTGIGIPENHQPYVFDAFYRVSRDAKGTGLGLAIAKTIVEAHGGRIWVESAPGKGSTFNVVLPKHQEATTSSLK